MDDGHHHAPTKKNILEAMDRVVQYSKAGDVVFIHYSGHGGRVRDTNGDEKDGYDEVSGGDPWHLQHFFLIGRLRLATLGKMSPSGPLADFDPRGLSKGRPYPGRRPLHAPGQEDGGRSERHSPDGLLPQRLCAGPALRDQRHPIRNVVQPGLQCWPAGRPNSSIELPADVSVLPPGEHVAYFPVEKGFHSLLRLIFGDLIRHFFT
jgi:hypothetical protein